MSEPKEATEATRRYNAEFVKRLPKDDGKDFEDAQRGFIGTTPDATVTDANGRVVWSMAPFAFEEGDAPSSVNPSLWRQAQLNRIHGLFEVAPGLYQVRGFDLSNITFIEGKTGVIIIDPLISAEPAAAALALYRQHRGPRPVKAVIYTHSHVDHYGGIRGVLSDADIASGLHILAPEGFLKEAVSENVLAGNAMGRRATYMYGALLPRGQKGHVDAGLGKTTSMGAVSLVPPTDSITRTGETRTIDGVEIVFQMTPDSEAPAEMNFHFPQFKALCMAENCTCHLHNILTPRGALVRDAKSWSRYIDQANDMFTGASDVVFASHHWPKWGPARIAGYLTKQRDLYKFIHDQTLRHANHGLTPIEIAEQMKLPPSLAAEWHTRDYYGTLNHNAKAIYQRYLGWFDGNPAHLHPHTPVESGKRYVDLAGGADALLAKTRKAFDAGDFRWVAEVVNHLVFADPANEAARALQADALEQLGYQAESGPWRSFYLTGAQELRKPRPKSDKPRPGPVGQIRALPAEQLLDSCTVRLNAEKAAAVALKFTLAVRDTGESFEVEIANAVLHHRRRDARPDATLDRLTLAKLVTGELSPADAAIDGDRSGLATLITLLDRFDFWFEIVAP
ncbi:MAG TPA: alkyl sulfatase dimerization domain-containing protein [Hyphomonadaceae bacterium]|nr:alkyl sulfatase dimerization domain-containing protein [Hyphomonadaceae bacterium]